MQETLSMGLKTTLNEKKTDKNINFMKKIVIEIDGVKHVPCKTGDGCEKCSLDKYCPNVIGSPCNDKINHFRMLKK